MRRAATLAGQARRLTIPETNPEQDVFRIGTLLEVGPRLPCPPAAHPLHRSGALPPLPPPRARPHARARAQLARELATTLASDGKRVKVSVQQALGAGVFQARCRGAQDFRRRVLDQGPGRRDVQRAPAQGMPLSLSGVRRIMERMDWGDAGAFVGFGEVGADQIDSDCDYYVLIAPQNVVGARRAAAGIGKRVRLRPGRALTALCSRAPPQATRS